MLNDKKTLIISLLITILITYLFKTAYFVPEGFLKGEWKNEAKTLTFNSKSNTITEENLLTSSTYKYSNIIYDDNKLEITIPHKRASEDDYIVNIEIIDENNIKLTTISLLELLADNQTEEFKILTRKSNNFIIFRFIGILIFLFISISFLDFIFVIVTNSGKFSLLKKNSKSLDDELTHFKEATDLRVRLFNNVLGYLFAIVIFLVCYIFEIPPFTYFFEILNTIINTLFANNIIELLVQGFFKDSANEEFYGKALQKIFN